MLVTFICFKINEMLVKNSFKVVELLYVLTTCDVLHKLIMHVFKW